MKTAKKKKSKELHTIECLGLPIRVQLYSVGEHKDYKTLLLGLVCDNLKNSYN